MHIFEARIIQVLCNLPAKYQIQVQEIISQIGHIFDHKKIINFPEFNKYTEIL